MSPRSTEPPPPSRVRLIRPAFYRSARTGALPPDVRDLMIGLITTVDDEGWLLWRLTELAAALYPYEPPARRLRDIKRRADVLVEAGLVIVHDCGCAFMPTAVRDHGMKGGNHTTAIWAWHMSHTSAESVLVRTDPSESRSSRLRLRLRRLLL